MAIVVTILIASVLFAAGSVLAYRRYTRLARDLAKRAERMNRRMYELAILKELGERVGYSLDVQQIVDIITGSLHQFIQYSAVSYMLLQPGKVIFKAHLEDSVQRQFVNDVRNRMLNALSALLGQEIDPATVEEVVSGTILVEEVETPVRSFFNIPLVIGNSVVGILTVADTKPDLYKEEDMTILYKITSQASQAVTKLQDVVATEQAKINAMVESMQDGIVMTDTDYRILVVNPKVRSVLGVGPDAQVTIFDFVDALEGQFDIHGKLDESMKLGKVFTSERLRIGQSFYEISVFPVTERKTAGGDNVFGAVIIFHDVTQDVELDRVREDFRSMLVHELRSPLSGIRSILEVFASGKIELGSDSYNEYVNLIKQNTEQMLALVNDILDVAKLEAGKFEVHKTDTDIKEILSNKADFYAVSAETMGVKIALHVDEALPTTLSVDANGIKQILNNLISNALKFSDEKDTVTIFGVAHEKGRALTTELQSISLLLPFAAPEEVIAEMPAGIIVGVLDSGIGMKKSDVATLFDKFKQLNLARNIEKRKGTGLGLVIAKGIVEAHGGKIHVVSEEGVGSLFFFVLPLEDKQT